jgi:hypothetical protein
MMRAWYHNAARRTRCDGKVRRARYPACVSRLKSHLGGVTAEAETDAVDQLDLHCPFPALFLDDEEL